MRALSARMSARSMVVVVVALLITVAPWSARRGDAEIPGLASWQSQMVIHGERHCARLIASKTGTLDPVLASTYYDATRVYYQIADYTRDADWNACALAAAYVYRDRYVAPHNAGVPGYWNFTTGLRMDFARTGNLKSKEWGLKLSYLAAYTHDRTDYSGLSPNLAREISYATLAYINAEELGAAPRAQRAAYVTTLYGFINKWVTNSWVGKTWQVSPFMMAMVAQALIRDWEDTGDTRLIPALTALADYLWTNTWETSAQAFRYQINPGCDCTYNPPGTGGAVDLNLIIAPMYAFLWRHTGLTRFRDRGDAAFVSGVEDAYLEGPKQFNQNYWWSFDYVKWRSGATVAPPVPSPTAPTVTFTAPSNGSTVRQTVNVSAAASGTVASLRLYLDGRLMTTASGSSVSYSWNTTTSPNGSHSWRVTAHDSAGNVRASSSISTTVSNTTTTTAPTIKFTSPSNGSTVRQTVTVAAAGSSTVKSVRLYLNGRLMKTVSGTSISHLWNTTASPDGSHSWRATAHDSAGNVIATASISTTVSNGTTTTAPTIRFTGPSNGSTLRQTVTVAAAASGTVASVRLYLDGRLMKTVSGSSVSYIWNTTTSPNGLHTWRATAHNSAGTVVATSSISTTVSNGTTATTAPTTAPTIHFAGPSDASTVRQTITVAASASSTVASVRLYLDGRIMKIGQGSSASFFWNTTTSANGSHSWTATAHDSAGKVLATSSVSTAVSN